MSVKRNSQRVFILVIVAIFFLTSVAATGFVIYDAVSNKDDESVATSEQQQLEEALKEGNKLEGTQLEGFTPVQSVTELQKIDTKVGDGEEVKPGATVTAHYTGAVASTGTIFQSSKDSGEPIPFGLDQVIKGWTDGVPGMKVGGMRRLVIPADQAYGANPPQGSNIPPNAPLVFDIELVSVQNP